MGAGRAARRALRADHGRAVLRAAPAGPLHRGLRAVPAAGLSVEATIWWLGGLFVLVLIAGAVRLAGRGHRLAAPGTIVAGHRARAGRVRGVNPDLRVAETQVAVRGVDQAGPDYLGDLGAEAVPALDRLPEPPRSCVLADVVGRQRADRARPVERLEPGQSRGPRTARPRHPVAAGGRLDAAAGRAG